MAGRISGLVSRANRLQNAFRHTFSRQHLKSLFTARTFTAGGYTAVSCLVVLAIAVVVVLAVEALPASYTSIDISQSQTTSISDETKDYLADLDDDVTIYLIATEGEEDEYIQVLLEKYEAANSHVAIEQKDPALYPGFTSQYTSDDLNENSLIVECGDSFKVLDYYDIYTLNSATYSYEFGGEASITSAIKAVTGADAPVIYTLAGHGESELPADIESDIELANMQTAELNLLSEGSVPDDADAVIMYAPQTDISDDEKEALLEYIQGGGSFMLVTDYLRADMPNVDDLMDSYGLEAVDGLVVEGNMSYALSGYPYYLLPTIGSSEVTEDLSGANAYVLFPLAHGIKEIDEYRSTLSIDPLLSTSENAYVKADPENAQTLNQEDGDETGLFMLGAAITEDVEGDGNEELQSRVIWLSSTTFLDSQIDMRVGGSNSSLMLSSVSWLAGVEDSTAISSKDMGSTSITLDSSTAATLSFVVVAVIPLVFLAIGFKVWRSRRSR